MISYAVAFALLAHVFFWGLGLATLIMPRPWRRFWPVLVWPTGFALQSLVVWIGAYANLRGTNMYAWPCELVPVVLLGGALWRRGWRRMFDDLGRFGIVGFVVIGVLAVLVLPAAIASRGLNSLSLGSCDAADYAAGARVFMEFAHTDRAGFIGLTEVVRVMSADNFFDFWLRLNHFTPSALIALNGSALHCAPHELTTLLTMVILAATVPVVFWMSRAVFRYSGAASLIIAGAFGISPIPWYSVAHVSPAPLLAANALALLNWAGLALWQGRLDWRRGVMFAGVLAVGYALVLGSYNFILIVSLVPAVAYAGTRTLWTGTWSRLARWLVVMLVPLGATSLVFWGRVDGLVERFLLFRTYDFGWKIPAFTPEGWLGMVAGGDLHPWSWGGLRWALALLVTVALIWALVRTLHTRRTRVWLLGCVAAPVLLGYAYLEVRGEVRGTNASYDAFKLFTVFYPLLLPAFCWWITLRWSLRLSEWFAVAAMAGVVLAFNLVATGMFVFQLSRAPLRVDGELRQLRKIETMADVGSVNLLLPDMWSRLWANELLLRKPQYFRTHTYEGRLNTELRGEWDLVGGPVRVHPSDPGLREVTAHYTLVSTRSPAFVRAEPGDGWYPEERLSNGDRWSWTAGDASIQVSNPHPYPIRITASLDGRSLGGRDVALGLGSVATATTYVHVPDERRVYPLGSVVVPPGRAVLVLHSKQSAGSLDGDARPLALCVFTLTIETSVVK